MEIIPNLMSLKRLKKTSEWLNTVVYRFSSEILCIVPTEI